MASQGGSSRLAQMQMRFQQKQLQEREQRKQEMTGTRSSSVESSDSKSLSVTLGPGKVRQMFDERRQRSTGIDKSYPLKPIETRSSSGTSVVTTKSSTTTVKRQTGSVKQVNGRVSSTKSETKETIINNAVNGNGVTSVTKHVMEYDNLDNEVLPDIDDLDNGYLGSSLDNLSNNLKDLKLHNERKNEIFRETDDTNNNNQQIIKQTPNSIRLKPVITKKTVPVVPPARTTNTRNVDINRNKSPPTPPGARTPTTIKSKTNVKSPMASVPRRTPTTVTRITQPSARAPTVPAVENIQHCKVCGRAFNVDRIKKHQQICERSAAKKRKVFDASKARVKGTEAEQYVRKATRTAQSSRAQAAQEKPKKSDWRQKHEEFIAAIRAAKEMQVHLAKGGKLSDLPPPPPSKNEDYIQCPHCGRRFNQAAASRHIPKCATMLHNKPKPKTKKVFYK